MTRLYSRYKFLGGFGLLVGLNILIGFGSFKLLTSSQVRIDKVDFSDDPNALFAYLVILGLNVLLLTLFMTQCRFIIADEDGISFINPVIPILRRRWTWSDFNYFILVDESARGGSHEAVWLIRDGKIAARFSSFYYTNYESLKGEIRTLGRGTRRFGPFAQFFALLGLKKIKN